MQVHSSELGTQTPEIIRQQTPHEIVLNAESIVLLTGRSNPQLARDVGGRLGLKIDEPVTVFDDTESQVKIGTNLRRKSAYIIQSTAKNESDENPRNWVHANDSVMEVMLMIAAARRASASEINLVIPYWGYGRQDRKDRPRVTISSSDVAKMFIEAGAARILTVDIHSEQQGGAIRDPWDIIYASPVLLPEIQKRGTDNLVIATADLGGTKRARHASNLLGLNGQLVIVDKERTAPGESKVSAIIGDVADKDVAIVDDIIDTAGSITSAAQALKYHGAKSVRVYAPHGLFNGAAFERIDQCDALHGVTVTDTVYIPSEIRKHPKISVITIADLLAESIKRVHSGESLSELIL